MSRVVCCWQSAWSSQLQWGHRISTVLPHRPASLEALLWARPEASRQGSRSATTEDGWRSLLRTAAKADSRSWLALSRSAETGKYSTIGRSGDIA